MQDLRSAVARHIGREFGAVSVNPIIGGTLGICFRVETSLKPFFVKTHQSDDISRENLLKEFELLAALYGHLIRIEGFDVELVCGPLSCILMDWLAAPAVAMTPSDVRSIIAQSGERLKTWSSSRATQFATIADLIAEGDHALVELERLQFISSASSAAFAPYIAAFKNAVASSPTAICHGDLSNKNIMLTGNQSIIIDWEDAFAGFEGYDYLYWLTFMDNRKYLSKSIFGHTSLGEQGDRGALIMIVAIKSLISVLSQSIRSSHVPIEQRLLEFVTF